MKRTIKLAGPNRDGNYEVVETTNYLYWKPGEALTEKDAFDLVDSPLVDVTAIPAVGNPYADMTAQHTSRTTS